MSCTMSRRPFKPAAHLIVLLALAAFPCAGALHAGPLYPGPGEPSPVRIDDSVTLALPGQDRQLPLRVVYPQHGGPYPVVVLSHGTFSSGKRYDPVARYWAARGYVVILPDHMDANYGVVPKKTEDMFRVIRTRVTDMSAVVDALDEVETGIPELSGRLDRANLIAAGHSIGTQIAMLVTGLRVRNPLSGEIMGSDEDRYKLLVMLSDPGKMAMMPDGTWTGSEVPTFLSTGTEDFGLMGDGRRVAEYQNEILSGGSSTHVDRYLLLLERGDHYFGGLIHKDVDGAPDHEGLEIFNAMSLAFMDAYVLDREAARDYLHTVDLRAATGGRASLTLEHNE